MIFIGDKSLRRILWFSIRRYFADQNSRKAIALTYYTVFSIVPVAALLFGIAKGFSLDLKLRDELMQQFHQHQEILNWICRFADTTLSQARGGIVAGVGVIVLIWSVIWLVFNIENAFNDVWGLPGRKDLLRRFSSSLSIILLTPLLLVVIGASGVALRSTFEMLAERTASFRIGAALMFASDLSPLIALCLLFFLIFKMVPNTKVRWGSALVAGIITGILFQLLQDAFIYLQKFLFRYNQIYGSFAILPLFLIWLQWSWQIVLFGAEIGFVSQNIGSGLFGENGELRNGMRLHRCRQLAIAALIYRRFSQGKGGLSLKELCSMLNLPCSHIEAELQVLTAHSILFCSAGDEKQPSYVPALPTDTLTAVGALQILEQSKECISCENSEQSRISDLLNEFDAELEKSHANCLLREL